VPDFFQNLYFPSDAVNVGLVLNLVLLEDLDCHLLLRNRVNSKLHLTEGTLAQSFVNKEIRYLPKLSLFLFLTTIGPRVWFDSENELLECFFLFLELGQLALLVGSAWRIVCSDTISGVASVGSRLSLVYNIEILITGTFRTALHFETR